MGHGVEAYLPAAHTAQLRLRDAGNLAAGEWMLQPAGWELLLVRTWQQGAWHTTTLQRAPRGRIGCDNLRRSPENMAPRAFKPPGRAGVQPAFFTSGNALPAGNHMRGHL